jgi:eukaryotic-like serine/threonine-protein kinase
LGLDNKNPTTALTALQAASPIEFGSIGILNNASCLYHVYIRGEAYLAAGQGKAAAAEFQKILDHSGIVWNCWTGALARLVVMWFVDHNVSLYTATDAGMLFSLAGIFWSC